MRSVPRCHVALWADSILRFGHKLAPDTKLVFHLEALPKGAIGWALGSMASAGGRHGAARDGVSVRCP